MPSMTRISLTDTRLEILSLIRQPGYSLPSLLFPVMFYVFFGLVFNMGRGVHMPTYLLASYGTFGVIAPALFSFGVGVAVERAQGWLRLRQASPAPPLAYVISKTGVSLAFAAAVALLLMTLGALFGDVRLERLRWFWTFGVLVFGTIPFCALGLWIGMNVKGNAAPAVVNLLYLPMSLLSGLWIPIQFFPELMQKLAWALPPFHLAQLAFGAVGMPVQAPAWVSVSYLSVMTLVFGVASMRSFYREDA
ncbi:hypothetical protein ABI59_00630 [Acidobacteria bacterium Mor1]|nr:hypothetical protein ABI59_00630 [Acidobacteria bacterium Mor1]